MQTSVKQKQIHISPRKLGLVCDLIRGKKALEAQKILTNLDNKGAKIVLKLLNSAIANASNNHGMDIKSLYILIINANQGKILYRTLPKAKGSASRLRKRHSLLVITLSDDLNDKKTLHRLPSGKSKKHIKHVNKKESHVESNKNNENIEPLTEVEVPNSSIDESSLPEVETPSEQLTPTEAVEEAAEIGEKPTSSSKITKENASETSSVSESIEDLEKNELPNVDSVEEIIEEPQSVSETINENITDEREIEQGISSPITSAESNNESSNLPEVETPSEQLTPTEAVEEAAEIEKEENK